MKKKLVTVGLLAGLAAGTGAGLIMQQTGIAGAVNTAGAVSVEEPGGDRPERGERIAEVLAPLVADGTITQVQADAVAQALVDAAPLRDGHRGPGHRRGHRGEHLETIAATLGITVDELRPQLVDGTSVADIAAAEGVDVQTVIDALVAEATAHLDEKVADGELTQEEADARLTEITSRITDMVNGIRPERPADDATADDSAG